MSTLVWFASTWMHNMAQSGLKTPAPDLWSALWWTWVAIDLLAAPLILGLATWAGLHGYYLVRRFQAKQPSAVRFV